MKLQWYRYHKGSESVRYILVLELGAVDGKLHCLESDTLSTNDVHMIRTYKDLLDEYDIPQRYTWMKEQCPSAVRAYRTIPIDDLELIKEYEIPGLAIPDGVPTAQEPDQSPAAALGTSTTGG